MDQRLRQVRKRLATDFAFYSKSALKIRTKTGEIRPLVLNPAQQILDDAVTKQLGAEGKIRVIILKARQQGLSTYTGGYLYYSVSQKPAQKAKQDPELVRWFQMFTDADGNVQLDKFRHTLMTLGDQLQKDEIDTLLKDAGFDEKREKTIHYTKLIDVMQQQLA